MVTTSQALISHGPLFFSAPTFSSYTNPICSFLLHGRSVQYLLIIRSALSTHENAEVQILSPDRVQDTDLDSKLRENSRYLKNSQFSCSVVSNSCDPMDCSTPGLPVHHQLPELAQTQVHVVGDAIQPSHPLSSPSPPAFNLSQHQGLFQQVISLHQVAKDLESQL